MYYYAQIDEKGYCMAVSDLGEAVEREDMIPIEEMEVQYLGKRYEKGQWLEREIVPEKEMLTDWEVLQQNITELELQGYEGQQERQLLAQQMAEIEILLLEGGMAHV